MKTTKASRRLQVMIAIGILFACAGPLLNNYVPIPDFVLGAMAGIGLGIMIVGLVWQRRGRACIGDEAGQVTKERVTMK